MAAKEGSDQDRSIPCNPSTEASVLGVCLSEGLAYWNQVMRVGGGDPVSLFYAQENRIVAQAIKRSIDGDGELYDSAVEDQLEMHDGDRLSVDPRTQLVQLQANTSITNLDSLIKACNVLVNSRSARRMLTDLERTRNTILTEDIQPNEISKELNQISVKHLVAREVKTMGALIDEIDSQEEASWMVPTGLTELDSIIGGGLEAGRNYVLAARPKIGKTTVMMNMILNSLHDGAVVLLVSLETLERDLIYKLIAANAFLDQKTCQKIRKGEVSLDSLEEEDREEYESSLQFLKDAPLYTVFPRDLTDGYHTIAAMVASLRAKYGDSREIIVYIDYLQLLVNDKYNEYHELSQYTRDLKLMAMEMGLAIVYLSQLSRDGADGGMPQVHHLRGSGTIEQDADVAIMLNRKHHYDNEAPSHVMDLWVAQNRVGSQGDVQLFWDPKHNVVSDMSESTGWNAASGDDDDDEVYD